MNEAARDWPLGHQWYVTDTLCLTQGCRKWRSIPAQYGTAGAGLGMMIGQYVGMGSCNVYLVDSRRRVLYSGGYDEIAIRDALAKKVR